MFEQENNNVQFACWSFGQKSHGSWRDWLECPTSCTRPSQCMEKTSKRSTLGRRQSWYKETIDILSNSIECNDTSRNTSSLLCSKSCKPTENWRSVLRRSIHVTSTSAKDLIEARTEKRIGFGSCSTTRRWSCSTNNIFPTNRTNSKSNSRQIGADLNSHEDATKQI